jgi:cobalamin synthase
MRTILGCILILAAIFFIVPMVMGGSANICQALEQHNVSKAAASIAGGHSGPVYGVINTIGQAGATGQTEAATQASAHPDAPTPVSCAMSFWTSL